MKKVLISVDDDLIKFFINKIDDTMPTEILLVKMLRLLRELIEIDND